MYIFRKARVLAEFEMVRDDSDPTANDTDQLTERMQKMIEFRQKMLADASVNINNAQDRYKKDYDKKRSSTEVCTLNLYIAYDSRVLSMNLPSVMNSCGYNYTKNCIPVNKQCICIVIIML